jgi:ribosome maturation factor RimP
MVDVDTIVRTLAPVVGELGLDLYDVELTGSGRARVLRVMVDREDGIDLDAVADATQTISSRLDAPPLDAVLSGPYALEVSSPGLERPLRTSAHWARAVGEAVSVKTRAEGDQHARRVRGILTASDDRGFDLTLDDGTAERLAYDDVAQARTVFEWGNEPKRTKSKKTNSRRTSPQRKPVRR